ncbi:hypothetical protein GCM10029964_093170 [Kibdelosporangium lantanae]
MTEQPPTAAAVLGAAPAGTTGAPLPTIGVDPGQTWTAAVLRVGGQAVHGWTIGPTDKWGTVRRELLNEVDNWDAFSRYVLRLVDALDELTRYAEQTFGEVRVAVEIPHVPVGFQEAATPRRFQRMRLCDWVIPRQVAAAVLGQYPEAKIIAPDGHGSRPVEEYPGSYAERAHRTGASTKPLAVTATTNGPRTTSPAWPRCFPAHRSRRICGRRRDRSPRRGARAGGRAPAAGGTRPTRTAHQERGRADAGGRADDGRLRCGKVHARRGPGPPAGRRRGDLL